MIFAQLIAPMWLACSKGFVLLKPAGLTFEQHALQGCAYPSRTLEEDVSRGATYYEPHGECQETVLPRSHAIHEVFNIILSHSGHWITPTAFGVKDIAGAHDESCPL